MVAISTAIGAGVGGVIAGQVTLRAEERRQRFTREGEERREQRERERDEQRRSRDLKEAARLVDEELRDATNLIRNAVYQGRWWAPPRQLSAAVYTGYRSVLAVGVDEGTWTAVSLAYQELNRVNWERSAGVPSLADVGGVGDPFAPLEREDLPSIGLAVVGARKALALLSAPPDKQSLIEQDAAEIAEAVFPLPEEDGEKG